MKESTFSDAATRDEASESPSVLREIKQARGH